MASKSSLPKSSNIQSNAPSGHAPSILQLSLWDLLAEATRVPLDAQLWMLFEDLDKAIAALPTEQQIFVAGEGLVRVGEIVGLRAEIHLQEINYLLHPEQEPVMALDVFDRYVRQSMVVDLEQFCAVPGLPEVERGYVRAVEPMSEATVYTQVGWTTFEDFNPPKSPLKRGTFGIWLPLFKGAGGIKCSFYRLYMVCVYTVVRRR